MKPTHSYRVQRKRNTLIHMPGWMTGYLGSDAVIISIARDDERRPQFLTSQTVLRLEDEGFGLTPESFHLALRFVKEHRGRNINIHCHQGIKRSKTLAQQLATVLPEYIVLNSKPDGVLFESHVSAIRNVFGMTGGKSALIRKHLYGRNVHFVSPAVVSGDFAFPETPSNIIIED